MIIWLAKWRLYQYVMMDAMDRQMKGSILFRRFITSQSMGGATKTLLRLLID